VSEIAGAIEGTVGDLFGEAPAQTEDTAAAVTVPEAEVAPETAETPAADQWDFEAAGRDLFTDDPEDVPDFDALAEAELGTTEQTEDVLAPTEYDDDQTRELKKRLLATKKQAEYHQRQHLTTARKAWEADVRSQPWGKFLPDDLSTIRATSHRDFQRQAKATARTNYTVLKPHFDRLETERAALREQTITEARAEATAAWGKPSVGGAAIGVPESADQGAQAKIGNAIRRNDMLGVTKAMIDGGMI
jgi:hypothetical protein